MTDLERAAPVTARPAATSRGYVSGPWGQVHYRKSGPEPVRVVLLHESPLSSRVYENVLVALGPTVGAVAFDTPGYGMSDPPPSAQSIGEYAAALLGAMRAVTSEAVVLVGVHTGASLAVKMAAQSAPSTVRALVLSGVSLMSAPRRRSMLETWAPVVQPDPEGLHLGWAWERYRGIYGRDASAKMLTEAVADLLAGIDDYHWAYNASIAFDPADDLQGISQPVLLLTAEHDILADGDRQALGLLANCEQHELVGLDGQPHMRDPIRFAAEVRAWLDRWS